MTQPELDWIVQKASELLADKVKDAPLTERDVKLAYEIFAEPRLHRLSEKFSSEDDFRRASGHVLAELRKRARELNFEQWKRSEL